MDAGEGEGRDARHARGKEGAVEEEVGRGE